MACTLCDFYSENDPSPECRRVYSERMRIRTCIACGERPTVSQSAAQDMAEIYGVLCGRQSSNSNSVLCAECVKDSRWKGYGCG